MKTAALALAITASASGGLVNGGFEDFSVWGYNFYSGTIPEDGWATTAPDNLLEIWENGFLGVPAYEGNSFAELNANYASTLYQHIGGIGAGTAVNWHFAHHGRYGTDTMRLTIRDSGSDQIFGNANDTTLFTQEFSADETAWVVNYGSVTSLGNAMSFEFEAVSAVGGNTQGNLIDWCDFGVGVIPAPGAISLLAIGGIISCNRRRR
jgi:hypothetical protein